MDAGEILVKIGADTSELNRKLDQVQGRLNGLGRSTGKLGGTFSDLTSSLGGMAAGMAVAGVSAAGMATAMAAVSGVRFNANIENATMALTTLTGSSKKAAEMIQQLQKIGQESPFNFQSLQQSAKLMLAMGIETKKVIPYMRNIGDAVAAVGGSSEQIQRVSLAISQMSAKGKVSAEEMNQLAENGIPAWGIISEKMGKSTQELMKMGEQGKLFSKDVIPVLMEGLDQRFGGAMKRASTTFTGMLEQMKEQGNMVLGKLFEPLFNGLKVVMPKVLGLLTSFQEGLQTGGLSQAIKNIIPDNLGAILSAKIKAGIQGIASFSAELTTKISEEVKRINWTAVLENLRTNIGNFAIGLVAMMNSELANKIQSGDWGAVGEQIGTMIATAISKLSEQTDKITGAIMDFIAGIDWVNLGLEAGKTAIPFLTGFVVGLFDIGMLTNLVTQHWDTALMAILTIVGAPARWIAGLGKALARIPFVGTFLAKFTGWINELGGPLRAGITRLVTGIGASFTNGFKNAIKGEGIVAALTRPFVTAGREVARWIGDMITKGNAKLRSWAGTLGSAMGSAWNAARNAATKGINKVYSVMTGFYNKLVGIKNKIIGIVKQMVIRIPRPKLPNISVTVGTKTIAGVPIPYPKFNFGGWKATGGIATGASIVGVGERGDEAIVPLSQKNRMRPFATAVADMIGANEGDGEVVINNYFTVNATIREEADIQRLSNDLNKLQNRRTRAGGGYTFGT